MKNLEKSQLSMMFSKDEFYRGENSVATEKNEI